MIAPKTDLLDEVTNICKFRATVSLIRDTSSAGPLRSVSAFLAKAKRLLKAVANIRFCFTPIPTHDWIIAYDGMRTTPVVNESGYAFITRTCKTNRDAPLPELLGLSPDDRYVLIDISKSNGYSGNNHTTLSFLFSLAGPLGLCRLMWQMAIGFHATRSAEEAFIYSALELVKARHKKTEKGLWLTTSTTWLAEVLRVALTGIRQDVEIVELLHGATSKNTAPYFEWVHSRALAVPVYVNLIADLPRFYPQNEHLLSDDDGEIACNMRLWHENPDGVLTISRAKMLEPAIAFIGGTSTDSNYSSSSFFAKELQMISELRKLTDCPIRYCIHPKHLPDQVACVHAKLKTQKVTIANRSTQAETIEARIVVGGFSTSLIEAALLGRTPFAYENLGELFIPEIANLVYFNENMQSLALQAYHAIEAEKSVSIDESLTTVSHLARKRYGLRLRPV